jgi:hypothetical protein
MPWIPNNKQGITLELDKAKSRKLKQVLELVDALQEAETPVESWPEIMVEAGARFRRQGTYDNYEWRVTTGARTETRIAYVEKRSKDEIRRMISIRNWFLAGDEE